MTTIVAVERNDRVIFGSDSQVTFGHQKAPLADAKFFTNGEYILGVAGYFEMLNILQNKELPDPEGSGADLDNFMSQVFSPHIAQLEVDGGMKQGSSVAIVSVRGRVYLAYLGQAPIRYNGGVYSVGSGSTFALGSLSTVKRPTERDVKRALLSASQNDIGTGGPFHVQTFRN